MSMSVALALLGAACGPSGESSTSDESGSTGAPATTTGLQTGGPEETGSTGGGSEDLPAPVTACAELTEVTAAPESIGEAIDFINALPQPANLDCFLERLERPLRISATDSVVSLQPALGIRSPRVFLFYGDLIMSVAIDGQPGNTLLEFGELVGPTKSIKGEVEFPIEDVVELSSPLERVLDPQGGSKCRLCHGGEEAIDDYEFAFSSDALKFRNEEEVTVDAMRAQYETCASAIEGERCARLDAIFGWGEVVQGKFPDRLQTIYDYE